MPEFDNILDLDFDSQMKGLFKEAEEDLVSRGHAVAEPVENRETSVGVRSEDASTDPLPTAGLAKISSTTMPQALRPMLLGIEAVTRATDENTTLLAKLEKAAHADAEARQELPKIVTDLRTLIETKSGVSHSMFTALHQELKGYKDGFLLESIQRPIIRDLISLFDDLSEIRRQLGEALAQGQKEAGDSWAAQAMIERTRIVETNVAHNIEFVMEVLARLQVTMFPNGTGKLDKRNQRAIGVEPANCPEDDAVVARSVKPGFLWNERIHRPEEVIVKKWRNNASPEVATAETVSPEDQAQ